MAKDRFKQFTAKSGKKSNSIKLPIWVIPVCMLITVIIGLWIWHYTQLSTAPLKNAKPSMKDAALNFEFVDPNYKTVKKSAPEAIIDAEQFRPGQTEKPAAKAEIIAAAEPILASNKPAQSIPSVTTAKAESYSLQLASFQHEAKAKNYIKQLGKLDAVLFIVKDKHSEKTIYRVMAGPFNNQPAAQALQIKLAKSKIKTIVVKNK